MDGWDGWVGWDDGWMGRLGLMDMDRLMDG